MLHTSCSNKVQPSILNEEETKENIDWETEIYQLFETYFRYIFNNNYSARQQNAKAYFIQIEGRDPSSDFLARFDGHSPPVKKGSEYIEGKGLLFNISSYTWLDGNTVKIHGGYHESGLSASSAPYIWEKKNGKWTLKAVGPMIIS